LGCRIRYLNSTGIPPSEAPALAALSAELPEHWLLYASFQYLPPRERPIDIDALIVMDDRVLLLEVKDWDGVLSCNGDVWLLDDKPRGRSAVHSVAYKARILGKVIREAIPGFHFYVDSGVLMTGTARPTALPADEAARVFIVDQLETIVDPVRRTLLLERQPLRAKKAHTYEAEFDRLTRSGRRFKPKDIDWDGYRVVQENIFTHPKTVWSEHRAVLKQDSRHSAILRMWAFDRLSPHLNTPDNRLLIANRDIRAIGYLSAVRSKLIPDGRILEVIGGARSEILTHHFDLRRLPKGWLALPSYLERTRQDIGWDDRVTLVQTLLNAVAELHAKRIAHRDLGLRNIWVESTTRLAIAGFTSANLPDDHLPHDWLDELRAYTLPPPIEVELQDDWQRDVYHVGLVARSILFHGAEESGFSQSERPLGHVATADWLAKAVRVSGSVGFPTVVEMSDEFGQIADAEVSSVADHSALDAFETEINPVFEWPVELQISKGRRIVYESSSARGEKIVVKIWPRVFRGGSAQSDLSLLRLFQGVKQLREAKSQGLPNFGPCGLSAMGAFVTHYKFAGTRIDECGPISPLAAARTASGVISAITTLNRAGLQHGNLDAKAVFVRIEGDQAFPIVGELFEAGEFGDESDAPAARLPANAEQLGGEHLDRFAAVSIALKLLSDAQDDRLEDCRQRLSLELQRPAIETLDTVRDLLTELVASLERPPVPRVSIGLTAAAGAFPSDNGSYYARAYRFGRNLTRYLVFGLGCRMNILWAPNEVPEVEVTDIDFELMRRETDRCERFEANFEFRKSGAPEVQQLIDLLSDIRIDDSAQEISGEEALVEPPIAETIVTDSVQAPLRLDTSRFWKRSVELEQNLVPELVIASEMSLSSATWTAKYDISRGNFDFDPEDVVDVHVPNRKRRIGRLDVPGTDGSQLAIKELEWNLRPGDVVHLVERLQQTSYDRRKRAVDRIIAGESPVKGLLEYFDTGGAAEPSMLGDPVETGDLDKYGLNAGQKLAFADIARHGPVGLLQGPPGTGKTKFIAAFVHWLATARKAERVLIASQSHEAVNNVIEAILRTFRAFGHRPNLLRIGSKSITAAVKPYHTASVRERYATSFSNSIRSRVSSLASSIGIDKDYAQASVDLDRQAGSLSRRFRYLLEEIGRGGHQSEDERRLNTSLRTVSRSFAAIMQNAGIPEQLSGNPAALTLAFDNLRSSHDVPEGDALSMQRLLAISREWVEALSSSARNFEEFLAKTKTIVTGTCVGLGQTRVRIDQADFDWVIVDEAARCTPGELAVPVQLGKRVLLVGDHLQLKPMVDDFVTRELCREFSHAQIADIQRSEFERAFISSYGIDRGQILNEQYRMAPPICELVSDVFYKPKGVVLTTSPDRRGDAFFASPAVDKLLPSSVTWIDTSGQKSHVERPDLKNPWDIANLAEANTIVKLLKDIQNDQAFFAHLAGLGDDQPIGIICMYKEQRVLLERLLSQGDFVPEFREMIRLETVDSYQGKENAVVIVSLVRCNKKGNVGHVGSMNRCNVAMSRAKERLVIVAATRMWRRVEKTSPMRQVLEYIDGMKRPAGEIIMSGVS
jgi:hypothetical protein